MDVYRIKGRFRMGHRMQPFTKDFAGKSQQEVKERLYSILGSMHGVKRRFIIIETMEKIKPDDSENPVVQYLAGKK